MSAAQGEAAESANQQTYAVLMAGLRPRWGLAQHHPHNIDPIMIYPEL
jgi:hypothetical protein